MAFLNKFLKSKTKDKEIIESGKDKVIERSSFAKAPASAKATADRSEGKEKGAYAYGVLLSPHVTEKSTAGNALNKYVFKVANTANKPEIKKAVESKYGVSVLNVRVVNTKSKRVRLGRIEGRRPGYKKAVVTLREGDKIEIGV